MGRSKLLCKAGKQNGRRVSPTVRSQVIEVQFGQDVLHFQNFGHFQNIDLYQLGLVQQNGAIAQRERNEGPVVAKHVQNALALGDMDAAKVLAAVFKRRFDRDAVFRVFHGGCLHVQERMSDKSGGNRMAERDLVEQAAEGIEDPDAFQEACAVFGDAGALARLHMFRADLETHLRWIGRDQADFETLRKIAHQTAGRAGVLGFPTLAEASARLDEAIRANTRVTLALERWTKQARFAAEGGADAHKDDTP
ncbi:Hpt domain-containing protein [Roseovarius nitratireducens]|uniref:Hpt domain-containing protein n=1 Tax=Roseovarius nitratireducens TaxID=2044597 RepID=UPI000CE1C12B